MRRGTITSYRERYGWGWLKPDRMPHDVFFHIRKVRGDRAAVRVGAVVEFEMMPGSEQRPKASYVRVLQ